MEKGNPYARRPVFYDATLNHDLQELDVDSLKQEKAEKLNQNNV